MDVQNFGSKSDTQLRAFPMFCTYVDYRKVTCFRVGFFLNIVISVYKYLSSQLQLLYKSKESM